MITLGQFRDDGVTKDYIITYENTSYLCKRIDGTTKWECLGVTYPSIKEIKAAIKAGLTETAEPEEPDLEKLANLWDCIDPCAHIVKLIADPSPEVLATLDNYGWLDEEGRPDTAQADRHYSLVKQTIKEETNASIDD